MISDELDAALRSFATRPAIVVASDYDGTLAPIVDDPTAAFPLREAIVGLRALAALPDTHVAVISGRSLRDLAALSRLPDEIHLVGSHGSEFDAGFASGLTPEVRRHRRGILDALHEVARSVEGSSVEAKPAGAAFHVRRVHPNEQQTALDRARQVAAAFPAHVKDGKAVIEFSLVETNKGDALEHIRRRCGADAALFLGDDATDEDAFRTLTGPDVGIKVGPGETAASARVGDPLDVARVIARLVELRTAWIEGHDAAPIEDHALLANGHALAILAPDGEVCWLCHPRPDSPSLFASLVGGAGAGRWRIQPTDGRAALGQVYVEDTMTVQTRWPRLKVTDSLLVPEDTPGKWELTELVRVIEGNGEFEVEFAPLADYGRAPIPLEWQGDQFRSKGGAMGLRLSAPGIVWDPPDPGSEVLRGRGRVLPGESITMLLAVGPELNPTPEQPRSLAERRHATDDWWLDWAGQLTVEDPLVRRSALTLKALCYRPSGSVLAAATTSLPEVFGGVRNWDYRLCWPRDSAHMCSALLALGSAGESLDFLEWLADRLAETDSPDRLRPLYPLVGDQFVPEAVIPTLAGYRGSRPVRVGNLAEHQLQLDTFGPVVDLVWRLSDHDASLVSPGHLDTVAAMVRAIATRWTEPDHGIWEDRRAPRRHVHSIAMCWMGVARAIDVFTRCGATVPDHWVGLADDIRKDLLDNGWNAGERAFTVAYGEPDIDAALLQIATCGILDPTDPRVIATVEAVEGALRDGATVRRIAHDDGLPGREGSFLVCTTWLVEALWAIGRRHDARELLRQFAAFAGQVGLFPEEVDARSGAGLGNFPQGYSHAGLIQAWVRINGGSSAGGRHGASPRPTQRSQ